MRRKRLIRDWFTATCLIIIVVGLDGGTALPNERPIIFGSFKLHQSFLKINLDALSKKVDIEKWPKTNILRAAPEFDKELLSNPELVTREFTSRGSGPFADETWAGGVGKWSWDRLVETTDPLPTDLPPERKARLLAKMSPKKRNDPNFVEEYLRRKLERYRKSKMFRVTGSIRVSLCVAPNSLGANEFLIYQKRGSSLPIEAIAHEFSESKQIEGLGIIGFVDPPMIMFVRDNIAVVIDARGVFASEAIRLARKIDSLIKKQTPLTYEQLLARRPSITIAERAEKTEVTAQKTVSYEVLAPEGQKIVNVRVYVDDRLASAKNGKIYIVGKKQGKVKVKLSATTKELLCSTVEQEVTIDE